VLIVLVPWRPKKSLRVEGRGGTKKPGNTRILKKGRFVTEEEEYLKRLLSKMEERQEGQVSEGEDRNPRGLVT